MGLFDHFPYTNFHELNLAWILEMLKEIDKTMDEFVAINALKYADPIQWNITSQYEKNTIVIDPLTGSAYISVQPVPNGVSLSNTDYWTVVFDLGMFVVKAAKNLATIYEADTTTSATVPIPKDTWLIWGDTLYKALTNITAGDTYVENGNIQHFTIEDVTGHLEDLSTTDKSNLVAAINELYQGLIDETDRVDDITGDLDNLTTTDKSNLVAAINEIVTNIAPLLNNVTYNADTVSDMLDLDAAAGNIVVTAGYHSINDGGAARYLITDTTPASYYETLNNGNFAMLLHGDDINVKQFGAYGDGVHDDTTAIQAALDEVAAKGSVYFPKDHNCTYLISSQLTLDRAYVTIYSDGTTEYETVITADDANFTMLLISQAGARLSDISFSCTNENHIGFNSLNGIEFYINGVGGANIDPYITNCRFYYLNDAITATGRNVRIDNGIFAVCKRGIVGHAFYENGILQDFRGWEIRDCRFHTLGEAYNHYGTDGLVTTPATLADLDSWCIEFPVISSYIVTGCVITGNLSDYSGAGFYKGFIRGCQITNNLVHSSTPILVYSPNNTGSYGQDERVETLIANNDVSGNRYTVGLGTYTVNDNFIYITGSQNLKITGNTFINCTKDAIKIDTGMDITVSDNTIKFYDRLYLDGDNTPYVGIYILTVDGVKVSNNFIKNASNNAACYGIVLKDDTRYIADGNFITLCTTPIHLDNCTNVVYPPATGWNTPTLLNGWVASTGHLGYRILSNGMLQLMVCVKEGTDNTAVFNLPSTYRPAYNYSIPCVNRWSDAAGQAYAQIETSGNVIINWHNTPALGEDYIIDCIIPLY